MDLVMYNASTVLGIGVQTGGKPINPVFAVVVLRETGVFMATAHNHSRRKHAQ
jgi:hypothetical protein